MSVTIQDVGASNHSSAGVTSFNYTGLTISGGLTNSAITVSISFDNPVTSVSVSGITGSSTPTQLATVNSLNSGTAQLWGAVNPSAGTPTIAVTWTGAARCMVTAVSWSGVDQTGGTTSFPHAAQNNGFGNITSTITLTSAVGNAVIALHATGDSGAVALTSLDNITIYTDSFIPNGANRAAGSASPITLTGTWASNDNWMVVGTDILAVSTGIPASLFAQICM